MNKKNKLLAFLSAILIFIATIGFSMLYCQDDKIDKELEQLNSFEKIQNEYKDGFNRINFDAVSTLNSIGQYQLLHVINISEKMLQQEYLSDLKNSIVESQKRIIITLHDLIKFKIDTNYHRKLDKINSIDELQKIINDKLSVLSNKIDVLNEKIKKQNRTINESKKEKNIYYYIFVFINSVGLLLAVISILYEKKD